MNSFISLWHGADSLILLNEGKCVVELCFDRLMAIKLLLLTKKWVSGIFETEDCMLLLDYVLNYTLSVLSGKPC